MSIGTLDKTVKIIELLSKSPAGMSVSEISRSLGFPKSTTHHILKTFLRHGFFSQNGESKKYSLGIKFLYVSSAILAQLDIGKIAEGHLLDLHEKSHEIVQLYIAREGKMVCKGDCLPFELHVKIALLQPVADRFFKLLLHNLSFIKI